MSQAQSITQGGGRWEGAVEAPAPAGPSEGFVWYPESRKRPTLGNPSATSGWVWPTSPAEGHTRAVGLCSHWGEISEAGSFWPQPLGFPSLG